MFAELPSPVRYFLLALGLLVVWCLLIWIDEEEPHGERVAIHVKLKQGGEFAPTSKIPSEVHLLFSTIPHDRSSPDPRARWWEIDVAAADADAELAALQAEPGVEEAYIEPVYTLPSAGSEGDSCPINTPTYDHHQEYLGPAPAGIGAADLWRRTQGQGVWFADIEGGWNAKHEDLPGARITHVGGKPINGWQPHGTAVLGEVVGQDNGKGVIGIAPEVERVFTSSIGGESVADAIEAAADQLRAGDVLLIELQATGPRGRYIAVEYWDDNYDAIRAAVQRGIIVIEAAGNGAEDLDHRAYKQKFDRWNRDSGAILVGAGAPPRPGYHDREKLDFSNYGARVDVQGWGRKVTTLDYGDLQRCSSEETHRHYTGEFSGTSSASPIVAGAAILLESWAKIHLGGPVSPVDVRRVLRESGTPQTGDLRQHIGPRPDLSRALGLLGE